jgi:hypothetical protein
MATAPVQQVGDVSSPLVEVAGASQRTAMAAGDRPARFEVVSTDLRGRLPALVEHGKLAFEAIANDQPLDIAIKPLLPPQWLPLPPGPPRIDPAPGESDEAIDLPDSVASPPDIGMGPSAPARAVPGFRPFGAASDGGLGTTALVYLPFVAALSSSATADLGAAGASNAGSLLDHGGGPVAPHGLSESQTVGAAWSLASATAPHRGAPVAAKGSAGKPGAQAEAGLSPDLHMQAALASTFAAVAAAWQDFDLAAAQSVVARAGLLGRVALSAEALNSALEAVLAEVESLGVELASWIDDASLLPCIQTVATVAAVGVAGTLASRARGRRAASGDAEAESSTWLFRQLQTTSQCP